MAAKPKNTKMKGIKDQELLLSEKQSICHFKKANPSATCMEISTHFHELWGRQVRLTTIRQVLKRKKHFLSLGLTKRNLSSKIRETECALYVGICDMASSSTEPVTGKMIRSTAKAFADELVPENMKFTCSNGWFDRFKRRFGINLLRQKRQYEFQHIHRNRESLMNSICETDLENVYILVPVQLCHLYNPRNTSEDELENTLVVFLCVNAAGTDMMTPLVLGSKENSEIIDKVHYVQEREATWGFIHWLMAADKHIKKSAKIVAGPHNFVTCLPFNAFQFQLFKTNLQSYEDIKHIFDKVTLLFKASFRKFQLQERCDKEESYLACCLKWIRDAWWGLPGGALHGYWHQISEIIDSGHTCTLPPDTAKLCLAIEDIAMKHLSSCLSGVNVDAKYVLNVEESLPKCDNLTINEIVNILLLYEQLRKTDKNDTPMEVCYENRTSSMQAETLSGSLPSNGHPETENITEDSLTKNHNGDASTSSRTRNDVVDVNGFGKTDKTYKHTKRSEEKELQPTQGSVMPTSQALLAIQNVISYLETQATGQKLYSDALKIRNYIAAQNKRAHDM